MGQNPQNNHYFQKKLEVHVIILASSKPICFFLPKKQTKHPIILQKQQKFYCDKKFCVRYIGCRRVEGILESAGFFEQRRWWQRHPTGDRPFCGGWFAGRATPARAFGNAASGQLHFRELEGSATVSRDFLATAVPTSVATPWKGPHGAFVQPGHQHVSTGRPAHQLIIPTLEDVVFGELPRFPARRQNRPNSAT